MKTTTVGKKLFFSVLAIFLVFAVCFIVFQQARERQYKIGILDTRLGDFNQRLATFIQDDSIFSEASFQAKYDVLKAQCAKLGFRDLRVTIVGKGGNVLPIFPTRISSSVVRCPTTTTWPARYSLTSISSGLLLSSSLSWAYCSIASSTGWGPISTS